MATKVKPSRLQVTGTPQAGDVPVYVDEDCFCWGAGGGGGGGCSEWGCITGTLCDQTDLQGALNCKMDCSALSDTNYGGAWNGDTTHTPTKNAIYTKLHTMDVEIGNKAADNTVVKLSGNQVIGGTKTFCISPVVPSKCSAVTNCDTAIATEAQVYNEITAINDLIPSAATCSNKLTDKNYVDDSINSVTAYYITKNAQGDQWACYAELANASIYYSGGVQRTPTRNDYTIVLDDECYCDATTRYIYNSGWEYQYTVNETAMTQSQLDALNSGITCAKVSCYDCCMAQCCDIPTDNCQLSNGCGYTTCTGTLCCLEAGSGISVSGCCIDNTGVTSVNSNTGAVTVNDVKVASSAPTASEGTVWYDTANDVLKTYDGSSWAETGGGDAKVFTLSGLTGATALAEAQAAYDYANSGKLAVIIYNNNPYFPSSMGSSAARFTRVMGYGAVSSGTWARIDGIMLTISSGSVTAIAWSNNLINVSSSAPASGTSNNTITLVI